LPTTLIDKDNLKMDESVGTFRWNNDTILPNNPSFDKSMRSFLLNISKGWKEYIETRFASS
jgi:hypothetical protein